MLQHRIWLDSTSKVWPRSIPNRPPTGLSQFQSLPIVRCQMATDWQPKQEKPYE